MKRMFILFCVLSILLAPIASYADDAALTAPATSSGYTDDAALTAPAAKPIQFMRKGYVDNTNSVREPATVNWVTGSGRKDGILEWAVDDNYFKKTSGMFLRGFSNTAFGWGDIVTHPLRWSRNAPLGVGTLFGLVMGPTVAILRTTSGAIDIATCWVPFWHGIPMKKPVLGLHDVHNYGTIEDVEQYNHTTKRYLFNYLNEEY